MSTQNMDMNRQNMPDRCTARPLRVINIGLQSFYDALIKQQADAVHIDWRPPVKQSQEIADLLDDFL
jgi:hypothetical protein